MKTAIVLVALVFLVSCTSPERTAAFQELQAAYSTAVADGVVTDTEARDVGAKLQAFNDAPAGGQDWIALATTALGTLAAGFFGLRYAPNSVIIGKQEAAALDLAAGIKKPT